MCGHPHGGARAQLIRKYLRRLIENGLLLPSSEKKLYTTTEEGIGFLEQCRKLNGPLMKKVGIGHNIWRQ